MDENTQDPNAAEAYRPADAGADADIDLDFDLDDEDFDDEDSDLMRIIGIVGGVAALIGGLIIVLGRRRATPPEKALKEMRQAGKAAGKALQNVNLSDLLSEARDEANRRLRDAHLDDLTRDARRQGGKLAAHAGDTGSDLVRSARKAAGQVDLEGTISELGRRLATIEREGRRGAGRARKEAARAFNDLDLSNLPDDVSSQLSDVWDNVTERAKEIGWGDAVDEAGKQVRQLNKQARRAGRNLDLSGLADLLDGVRDQLSSAGDSVQGALGDDVLPAARKRARAAGEALSSIAGEARQRGSDLADEYAPQAKKAAGKAAAQAGGWGEQAGTILQAVGMEILHRVLNDALPGAKKAGERVADTARDDTFPWLRHRAGEVRDRVQHDVAPKVRDFADEAPGRVRDAVDSARPVVADTLSSVGDTVARLRPKAGEVLQAGGSGVGGALSTVGRKAGNAAGAAVGTTKYVTGESSRILFWLSMLSGMILLVFVPDKQKQQELWGNMQEFFGELRSMWGDFNSDEFESEADSPDYTGDAGV